MPIRNWKFNWIKIKIKTKFNTKFKIRFKINKGSFLKKLKILMNCAKYCTAREMNTYPATMLK